MNNTKEDISVFIQRTGNLLIHLLNTCNLSCQHCYLNADKYSKKMIPYDLVVDILEEADDLSMKSVQFSGGEPFLFPKIFELLESANNKSYFLTVSTNGTLINERAAERLADLNIKIVTSIDGPAEYHDRFRAKIGAFAQTEKAIKLLVQKNVPVKLVATICRDNLDTIDWLAEWALSMGVESIQFQPLEKIGRGANIESKRLQGEELHDLFIRLNDAAVLCQGEKMKLTMTYQSREYMLAHPCSAYVCNGKKCHRGIEKELKKIVIREDGAILPELVDIDRKYAIGNIFDNTLTHSIKNFLEQGYAEFDHLCRTVYKDSVINSSGPLVAWGELLIERSKEILPNRTFENPD